MENLYPNPKNRLQNGFTLVELLVVIAIISILASLLMPAIQRARQKANVTACQSNLHQLGIALAGYGSDHGNYGTQHFYQAPNLKAPFSWNQRIVAEKYVSGKELLKGASGTGNEVYYLADPANPINVFRCPTASKQPFFDEVANPGWKHSISYNINAFPDHPTMTSNWGHPGNLAIERVEDPVGTYLLYDMNPMQMHEWNSIWSRADSRSENSSGDVFIPRYHLGGGNFLYADYHTGRLDFDNVTYSKGWYWLPSGSGVGNGDGDWSTVAGD